MLAACTVFIFKAETLTTFILVLFANSERFFHFRFSVVKFIVISLAEQRDQQYGECECCMPCVKDGWIDGTKLFSRDFR